MKERMVSPSFILYDFPFMLAVPVPSKVGWPLEFEVVLTFEVIVVEDIIFLIKLKQNR
jgi:hypothetical protein